MASLPEQDHGLKEAGLYVRECQQRNHLFDKVCQNQTEELNKEKVRYEEKFRRDRKSVLLSLQRLHVDKSSDLHVQDLVSEVDKMENPEFNISESPEQESGDVISANPYPVTLTRLWNQPAQHHFKNNNRPNGRRISLEYEDLDAYHKANRMHPEMTRKRVASLKLSQKERWRQQTIKDIEMSQYWVGEPEAISSVRRHRRTVEEQHRNSFKRKLNFEAVDLLLSPRAASQQSDSHFSPRHQRSVSLRLSSESKKKDAVAYSRNSRPSSCLEFPMISPRHSPLLRRRLFQDKASSSPPSPSSSSSSREKLGSSPQDRHIAIFPGIQSKHSPR